jgi:hypothetical protein
MLWNNGFPLGRAGLHSHSKQKPEHIDLADGIKQSDYDWEGCKHDWKKLLDRDQVQADNVEGDCDNDGLVKSIERQHEFI